VVGLSIRIQGTDSHEVYLAFKSSRVGFGRCEASFHTLWEETLHTCPKPSPASSDRTTTLLDDKTITFFTKYFLFNKISQRVRGYLPRSSRKHGDHGALPPCPKNHVKTWRGHGMHRQKNIRVQLAGVSAHWFDAKNNKKHVHSLKKTHTFCQHARWSAACGTSRVII